MLTIYVVRHAEAEGNIFRRAQGRYNSYLTANGKLQLRHIEKRFEDVPLDAIYASDLRRTAETANAVRGSHKLPIRFDPRLREIRYGEWEDMNWGEIAARWPEKYDQWTHCVYDLDIPGGENDIEAGWRLYRAVADIAAREYALGPDRTVAIVSHGTAMRDFTCVAKRLPFYMANTVKMSYNTSVIGLFYNPKDGIVYRYDNDVTHMPAEMNSYILKGWWERAMERNLHFIAEGDTLAAYKGRLKPPFDAPEDKVGELRTRTDGQSLAIERMELAPEYRCCGSGAVLLGRAISDARKLGLKYVDAEPDNGRCAHFFEKWGFELADAKGYANGVWRREAGDSKIFD